MTQRSAVCGDQLEAALAELLVRRIPVQSFACDGLSWPQRGQRIIRV
jgi:hypothetical protein